jgi:hypothetical protein
MHKEKIKNNVADDWCRVKKSKTTLQTIGAE